MDYATLDDVMALFRPLGAEEQKKARALIPVVSATLRQEAKKLGYDLNEMAKDEDYAMTLKSVTVDVVARTLMTSTNSEPMTQESQSALGYTWSGSYLVPGGGLFIKRDELKRLGLRRQRIGVRHLYGEDKRDSSQTDY